MAIAYIEFLARHFLAERDGHVLHERLSLVIRQTHCFLV